MTSQANEPNPASLINRRQFLSRLSTILGAIGASILCVPSVGFLLSPLIQTQPELWRKVGLVENFPIGRTIETSFLDSSPLAWAGVAAKTAAWVRRETADRFIAYSVNCSHLGCPVRWLETAELFICPCHGGVYDKNGAVAAGPPLYPLAQYRVRVRDGEVEILTSAIPFKGEVAPPK